MTPRARAAALALALAAPAPAQAALYALVIGIDDYQHIAKLKGAVNDALAIAEAVRALGPADLRVLLDAEATRAAVLTAWTALAAQAGPGDTLIVTYAGHGGNEPAAFPASEDDGRDENLQLAGFRPVGPAAGERIRDDEIAALIALSPHATVLFVADSCHSGTVTRAARSEHGYRFNATGAIVDDPLPRLAAPSPDSAATHIFFGAVPENEKVPEYTIENRVHGAMSFGFAQALRGAADADGDGRLTKGELERNVRQFVYRRTDGQQSPQVAPTGQTELALVTLPRATPGAAAPGAADAGGADAGAAAPAGANPGAATPGVANAGATNAGATDPTGATATGATAGAADPGATDSSAADSPFAQDFDALPPVPLEITGDSDPAPLMRRLGGVAAAAQAPQERLVWDIAARELRSEIGDVLLALTETAALGQYRAVQAALVKMRVVRALRAATIGQPMNLDFTTGSGIYAVGDQIAVSLTQRQHPHTVLFNLAADGQIAWLYPTLPSDPATTPPDQPLGLTIQAAPPLGADHLVAVETAAAVPALRRALARHDGTPGVAALWTDLHHALGAGDAAVALFPFFTAPPTPPP